MERVIYAALVRLLLPRRMRERLGDDMLRCHDDVMGEAARSGRRLRVWFGEISALLRASGASRSGGGPRSPHGAAGRRMSRGANRRWHLAGLADDLRHALRSLLRSPASTAFVVLMLGGGLGAAITVYSAVRHTLIHPLPYEGADRFANLWRTVGEGSLIHPTPEQVETWGGQADLVEGVLRMAGTQKTLTGRGEPESFYGVRISGGYFRTLGITPALGRTFTADELADDATRSLLLGHDLWRNRFGSDPSVLGTSVSLDGEPWTVIGVGPRDAPLPTGFPEDARFWMPLTPSVEASNSVVILRAGVSLEAFVARIDTLVARANAEAATPSPFGGTATSAQQMVGTGRLREALTTLSVAVGLMLLIACLNASALLVNRADRRRHETAVRVALGAGRGRVIRQHLIESMLLALAAGLAGVALAAAGLQLVPLLRPEDLSLLDRASLDGPVIGFSLALTALTGLVFGLLPAWQAASRGALNALRRGRRGGQGDRGAQRARWGLVVAEVALSFTLLVGGGLLVRTMIAFNHFDVGYQPEGVLVANVRLPAWSFPEAADRAAAWERVLDVSRGITGVESVTLASGVPPRSGVYFAELEVEGREITDDERRLPFFGNAVGPTYFSVLDQRLVAGRGFTDDEAREGAPVYVVSESTARALWPDDGVAAAVGRRMRLGTGDWRTVVGIVSDVPATGLTTDRSTRQLYMPHDHEAGAAHVVLRVAGDTRAAIPALVERLRIVAPDAPLEINEAVALLGESVAMQRFTARLLTLLAALAALLASAGMYGVVAETVGRRTQEIGIRMSLGAHGGAVVWMVLKAGAVALALGVTLGVGLSLVSARVIESQLFGVEPGDLPTYIAAGLALSAAALVATWLPARRAARIDPVRAMSSE